LVTRVTTGSNGRGALIDGDIFKVRNLCALLPLVLVISANRDRQHLARSDG
jgi:hypothetical protein